jgi:hypothetical protein
MCRQSDRHGALLGVFETATLLVATSSYLLVLLLHAVRHQAQEDSLSLQVTQTLIIMQIV